MITIVVAILGVTTILFYALAIKANQEASGERIKRVTLTCDLKRLAETTWRNHYKKESPNFECFDDPELIVTQLDNMLSGLTRKQP